MSFRGMEDNPKLREFHDMIVAIDEQMIEDAVKNSRCLFKET